jgi:V-type H+-transporting ATPase subunit H
MNSFARELVGISSLCFKMESLDFGNMTSGEISSLLYSKLDIDAISSSSPMNIQLVREAETSLDRFVNSDGLQELQSLVNVYLSLLQSNTQQLSLRQYVFTKIEEILYYSKDGDLDIVCQRHVSMFLQVNMDDNVDGVKDGVFVRALGDFDPYLSKTAAKCLSTIYAYHPQNVTVFTSAGNATSNTNTNSNLMYWVKTKLKDSVNDLSVLDVLLPSLSVLVMVPSTRSSLMNQSDIITNIAILLKKLGVSGNPQHIYELCFVMWAFALTLTQKQNQLIQFDAQAEVEVYVKAGCIPLLVDLVAAATSRKILRMSVAILHLLSSSEDGTLLLEIFATNLPRLIDGMAQSSSLSTSTGTSSSDLSSSSPSKLKGPLDPEFENDVLGLNEVLIRNHRELSTFERWSSEVHSGSAKWGVTHTEKFWKENNKKLEVDDWKWLKALIKLLDSGDEEVLAVALFDLGEFSKCYPNGKILASNLGGKEKALRLIQHSDEQVQKHALQCISKIMIGWDSTAEADKKQ